MFKPDRERDRLLAVISQRECQRLNAGPIFDEIDDFRSGNEVLPAVLGNLEFFCNRQQIVPRNVALFFDLIALFGHVNDRGPHEVGRDLLRLDEDLALGEVFCRPCERDHRSNRKYEHEGDDKI